MKNIIVAGGTGFLGRLIVDKLKLEGYNVRVLTRSPKSPSDIFWSPKEGKIATKEIKNCEVLINVCGAPIDGARWTNARKKELEESRIGTTNFLYSQLNHFEKLEQFISASGVTCYGFDDGTILHSEDETYGDDYLSQLVKEWEHAANQFESHCKVTKMRIAVVLDKQQGALKRLSTPIKWYVGSPIGSGKQMIPWVHRKDLARLFCFVIEHQIHGTFNTNASNISNDSLTKLVAKRLHKPIWLPNVPGFIIKLLFGQLSDLILKGASASNESIKSKGFTYIYPTIDDALDDLYLK